MEKIPTRQLILEAVVACVEKYGIDRLTTRRIAQEAGTNIASINYYFRTKEDLVAEAMTMTVSHMMEDVLAAIDDRARLFQAVLTDVFFYLIDGAVRFPGITTAHLYSAVVQKRYDSPGARGIRSVFDRLVARTVAEYPRKDAEEVRLLLSQAVSSIMFTMLAPGLFVVAARFEPTSSENCRTLAEHYASVFLTVV